jgi:phage tail protein X
MTTSIQAAKYTTRQGDTVDYICWRYYGTERGGTTEAVLEANPGLAQRGPVLPAGLVITLPAITLPGKTAKLVELWD